MISFYFISLDIEKKSLEEHKSMGKFTLVSIPQREGQLIPKNKGVNCEVTSTQCFDASENLLILS